MNALFGIPLSGTPVTIVIVAVMATLSLLASIEVVYPYQLAYSYSLIFEGQQYWRIVTSFLFFGKLSFHSVFEIQWFYFMGSHLEAGFFFRGPLDFIFILLVGCSAAFALRVYDWITTPLLSSVLSAMVTYLMSRVFQTIQVNVMFFLNVPLRYLPLVFLVLNTTMSSQITSDLLGYGIGHFLWYFLEVFPQITGLHLLRIQRIFDSFIRDRDLNAL